ncbi:MAG: RNA polymerase sigma factor [Saprospiraceae bacterium]
MSPLILNSVTEKELIQLCIRGDRSSQKKIYDVHAPKMMAVCLRYAKNKIEAEDIFQEGFIRVFKHIGTFAFEGSFEGWIRRIMINTALKYNSKKTLGWNLESLDNIDYHDKVEPSVISSLSEEEIIHYISELPQGYRMVFNLFVIEGFSHKEIGEMMEIEESTSRSQLVKARKMLQQKLTDILKMVI